MTRRRALDRCRREVDDSRVRPIVVDEPIDDSVFIVWPSIDCQLPSRSVILDMLCFYATPTIRSDLMQPLAFDESAWLAAHRIDIVRVLARLPSDTVRTAAVRAALPILSRPTIGASEFVTALAATDGRTAASPARVGSRTTTYAQGSTR